jgi:predicted acyl esterase
VNGDVTLAPPGLRPLRDAVTGDRPTAAPGPGGLVRTGLRIVAPDGVRLVADLVLPDRVPAPVVVIRTPYGATGCHAEALALAESGFACLVQDVRGRHLSQGEFDPGADETADGHATLGWAASQPWCDGDVLLYGIAYEAYAAWCAAGHPAVRGVVSRQPWPPVGTPALDEELWWRTDLGTGRLTRPGLFDLILARDRALTTLIPTSSLAGEWPVDIGTWPPTPSTYKTAARRVTRAARTAKAPSLHLGSWYCRSAGTTLRQALLARDADVVMGGWAAPLTHRLQDDCAIDVPVEPHPFQLALEWLAGARPRRCLLLGSGRWTDADPVPPRPTRWVSPQLKGETRRLRHDPASPYPSAPHSADLAPLPVRDDVVRLSADGPIHWHGSPRVVVETTADAGAELVATLVHQRPDGAATRIADGTVPLPTGDSRGDIRLTPGAVELPTGHRLYLELTAGRQPRHPAPGRPALIEMRDIELRLPQPRKGAFE